MPEHNQLALHDWGLADFQLASGATTAALVGDHPSLRPGMVLILEAAALAPSDDEGLPRRWPVRLTDVERGVRDPLTPGPGGDDQGVALTVMTWGPRDALPFALAVSGTSGIGGPGGFVRGNVVLADHGLTLAPEALRPPDDARAALTYRPRLRRTGLTWSVPDDGTGQPAAAAIDLVTQDVHAAVPALVLASTSDAVAAAPTVDRPPGPARQRSPRLPRRRRDGGGQHGPAAFRRRDPWAPCSRRRAAERVLPRRQRQRRQHRSRRAGRAGSSERRSSGGRRRRGRCHEPGSGRAVVSTPSPSSRSASSPRWRSRSSAAPSSKTTLRRWR